jgi:hypothetical protein
MKGFLPLIADTVTKLHADATLRALMGGKTNFVFTERPGDRESMPYCVLDVTNVGPWNDNTYRGSEYTIQVSAFYSRGATESATGVLDAGQAAERIRQVLDYNDKIALDTSPTTGEELARLVLRQYVSGAQFIDPDEKSFNIAARFRCLVSGRT